MVSTVADAQVHSKVHRRVSGTTITTPHRTEGRRAQRAAGGDGQGSRHGVGRDDGSLRERCAKQRRENGSASVRHFIPGSCPASKPEGRAWRAENATVRPEPRRWPSKIITARSTRPPSNFDAAAITIVVTVMIITVGAAVTDTSPSCRGIDRRPSRMVQGARRTDDDCGATVGTGTTERDLKTRASPSAMCRLNGSARDERATEPTRSEGERRRWCRRQWPW